MSWTNQAKNIAVLAYLLLEDGAFLLLEDGGKLLLESSNVWNYQTKN